MSFTGDPSDATDDIDLSIHVQPLNMVNRVEDAKVRIDGETDGKAPGNLHLASPWNCNDVNFVLDFATVAG